ncbi:uncharacterized protein LOC142830007 [Pelodiscus sinensis]|uniref:uncharacterized protein LOC142830007 n=1 Tax=Pelodiscus sinensis TaxID=13735 RepID=UPI003F6BE254
MYQLKVQAELPAHSGAAVSALELKALLWSRGECNGDDALRKKQLAQQLVEEGECEEQLMAGGQQAGALLAGKAELGAQCWQLPCEPDEEEIYWGCFYFFPWLRAWRRGKREQP